MRILIVSDVHCEEGERNVEVFKRSVEFTSPDVILGLGDWGDCENYSFMEGFRIITIYGNHDNVLELSSRAFILDGNSVVLDSIRIGGISGIVSIKGTPTKRGTPRKKPEEFIARARALGSVDVLLMHEAPYIPEVFGKMWKAVGPLTALTAFDLVKPKLLIVGHLHKAPALHARWGRTHVFHLDTSAGGFLLFDTSSLIIEGYKDLIRTFRVSVRGIKVSDAII